MFAIEKHKGQLDDDGRDFVHAHLFPVSYILQCVTEDEDIIAAGILHDTIEDTDTSYEEIAGEFGERVANIVYEVTHEFGGDSYGYYFPRLKTRDAVMVKFADRLSNISRMDSWPLKRREHYLKHSQFWRDGSDLPI